MSVENHPIDRRDPPVEGTDREVVNTEDRLATQVSILGDLARCLNRAQRHIGKKGGIVSLPFQPFLPLLQGNAKARERADAMVSFWEDLIKGSSNIQKASDEKLDLLKASFRDHRMSGGLTALIARSPRDTTRLVVRSYLNLLRQWSADYIGAGFTDEMLGPLHPPKLHKHLPDAEHQKSLF